MSLESHPDIPIWIQNRIVGFFNWARNVGMVLDGTIQDDPSDGPGNTMGRVLAAQILREKANLPRRRFPDLAQLDAIRGVGPGTIKDLVYSFGTSADEAFQKSMYDSGTIYRENWPLEYFRFTFDVKSEFEEIARDSEKLRAFVAEKVAEVSDQKGVPQGKKEEMIAEVEAAYIDYYSNSTRAAVYALALYFYEFDADNWFSYEDILGECQKYFDHNSGTYPWFMDLQLFRGVSQRGIVSPGISPDVMPVVVNWAEQAVTFWVSELYD